MDTHYHVWHYRRDPEGTIRSMERDDTVYATRRKANYALSDGRQYWKAGQVLQCVDGAFCRPLPEEMVDRGMLFGPRHVPIEQLEKQARSIRPAAKHIKAMKLRDELEAQESVKSRETAPEAQESVESVKSREAAFIEIAERQAKINAELARLFKKNPQARVPPRRQG